MVALVMTPSNLIGDCQCFLGNLVRPSSLSKCSVPIILFRAEALDISEDFFYQKLERIKHESRHYHDLYFCYRQTIHRLGNGSKTFSVLSLFPNLGGITSRDSVSLPLTFTVSNFTT
jgi:hypothetical protein